MAHTALMFWSLYKKDLKQMRGIGLALVGFGIVVCALYSSFYYLPRFDIIPYSSITYRFRDLCVAMLFVFPTLLAYILYLNRHDESRYQTHSLPLWRSAQIITAYAALMTYVVLYTMISRLISACWYTVQLYNYTNSFQVTVNASGQDIAMNIFEVIRHNIVPMVWNDSILISNLSGMVCLAAGIATPLASKRWGWYWTGFIGMVAIIYSIPEFLGRFGLDIIPPWWLQTYLLPGLIFVVIGALMYQRYAEA